MNRLTDETSPYLRQHADNPVDWFPWGDEAFGAARDLDRPVLLSIGYSSCHWCHVMAHESFEDPETAALMNEHFINIKVDREERPDVDAIYMEAVQRMTGHGGWPMTMFLTPDGRPFFGGTYFPKTPRTGMPSFGQIVIAVAEAWNQNRSELLEQAENLTNLITESNRLGDLSPNTVTPDALDAARSRLIEQADRDRGGFGRAPKFPMAMALRFLAGEAARRNDHDARSVVVTSLDAMAAGGIHDHVGGGFHRYSTDNDWLVPHFEKMLYDQAMLLRAFTAGFALTGSDVYARVVAGIVAYVTGDLADPAGGWYAAEDADSGGVEGAFFCWQPDELRAALTDDAEAVIDWAAATERGNFTDPHTGFTGTILHAADHNPVTPPEVLATFERLRHTRAARVRPGLDDKVLLGWNAMFAAALAEAAIVFARPEWMDAARRNLRFLTNAFRTETGYARSWQAGRIRHRAVLEDVAALLGACVTLGELDDPAWLGDARAIAAALDAYRDHDGVGWFDTPDATDLIVRPKDVNDNAVPAGNSLAVDALLRLAALIGEPSLASHAAHTVAVLQPSWSRHPLAFGYLLESAARLAAPTREIVIVAEASDPTAAEMHRDALGALGAGDVFVFAAPGADVVTPLLEGRMGLEGSLPRAYVCHDGTCDLPVNSPTDLRAQLDR